MDGTILVAILITFLIWIFIALAIYIFFSRKIEKIQLGSFDKLRKTSEEFNSRHEGILREKN